MLHDKFLLDGPSNRILDYIIDFVIKLNYKANTNCSAVVAQFFVSQLLHVVKADV